MESVSGATMSLCFSDICRLWSSLLRSNPSSARSCEREDIFVGGLRLVLVLVLEVEKKRE